MEEVLYHGLNKKSGNLSHHIHGFLYILMNYPNFWTIQSTKGVTKGVSFPSTGWLPLCFTLTNDSLQLESPN